MEVIIMKNLVSKESIEAVAVKEENIMETQIAVGKEAFSKEVVLRNIAQKDISLQKLLGYNGDYDFYDPKLFMLGLKDGETISEALLRRGANLVEQVCLRKCHTDYFKYRDGNVMVAVSYNREGIGRPILIDTDDYYMIFKGRNMVLNHQGDFTKALNNPMPVPKTYNHNKVARLVLGIQGVVNGVQADHINCNRLDNRKENLRAVTNKQNSKNRASSKNVSGDYAYEDKNDYRFGTAVLIEQYFFGELSAELASAYNQILLEHFSSISYSAAS